MKTKNSFFKILGVISVLTATAVVFSGCQPDNPQPNGSVTIKWNATINGQNYTWQDNYPQSSTNVTGGSQYSKSSNGGSVQLAKGADMSNLQIVMSSPNMTSTGSFSISSSNYSTFNSFYVLDGANPQNMLSTSYGGNITVNITTFPTNSVSANGVSSNPIVKGNFSGSIGNTSGGTVSISGSFESIRLQ
jgi:hypothetical protein